jgi:His Kinase A (phospho-acceptor) domain
MMISADTAAKSAVVSSACQPLLGIADPVLAEAVASEVLHFTAGGPIEVAPSLLLLREAASRLLPDVIVLDYDLLAGPFPAPSSSHAGCAAAADGASIIASLRQLAAVAPVVLIAPLDCCASITRLIASDDLEFVARTGDFIPLACALIERRLRWAAMSKSMPISMSGPPWTELPADIGSVFRHEVNNPLTGILGNAELLLSHRERLAPVDAQRLQTVVDLAVRLRETVRRLGNAFEAGVPAAKSA